VEHDGQKRNEEDGKVITSRGVVWTSLFLLLEM
jgi:hypothetical protein